MIRCRLLYLLALAGAVLYYIFDTSYFSWYTLVLVAVFPLFSLAVSLPGMLCCSIEPVAVQARVRRGGRCGCQLRFSSRYGLPVARAAVKLEAENLLTGEKKRFRERFSGGARAGVRKELDCLHCGCIAFTVRSFWVCDLLGLFSIPRRAGQRTEVLVLPAVGEEEPPVELVGRQGEGAASRPRPGGGPGEDYDLRPYRPGDPLRSVHWKLTAKLDEPVVRETLEVRAPVLLLTFDRSGPIAGLDTVLARLEGVSRWLLAHELPHYVQWLEPGESDPRQRRVGDEGDLYGCLRIICAARLPDSGPSMLDVPLRVEGEEGPIRRLHLAHEEQREGAEG